MGARQQRSISQQQVYRRRRFVAAIVALALVALVVAAVSSSGGGTHATATAAGSLSAPAQLRPRRPPAPHVRAEEAAIDRVLSYAPAVASGGSRGHEVALTFDDGPGPYTQTLVGVLNRLHVHATFFAIGEEERYFSAGTRLELASGDVVGDHTETHPMMAALPARYQSDQLLYQIARIELLGGPRPRLFRPPYGSFDATTFALLRKLHLLMVLWSTDTRDYTRPGVSAIVHAALAGAHPGAIILMHDAGGDRSQTIAALPKIIAGLRKRGLRPVTVPRLLRDDPPPRGWPVPTSLGGD
jgi:peptidoglycan/xylan/chitin deacetylase (PgdA/CDA1 family)